MMLEDLRQKQQELPSLRSFLHKLSPRKRLVRVWQKRFFFVRDSELCYSREKLDANLQEDTLGWYLVNAISLLSIKRIFPSQVQPLQFGVEVIVVILCLIVLPPQAYIYRLATRNVDICASTCSRRRR